MAKSTKEKLYETLASEVNKDFRERQMARRPYELAWQLNMNFLMGNQYCGISPKGTIEQEDKSYYWQEKQVFNHIAPIVETRIARLNRVRPKMSVRPFSNSQEDIVNATTATKILESINDKMSMSKILMEGTSWSEVTGTAFYKITWNMNRGEVVNHNGKSRALGDVDVTVVPPYELYPDSNVCSTIEDCNSIIHAKAYSTLDVKRIWGVDVMGESVKIFSLTGEKACVGGFGYNSTIPSITSEAKNDHVIVIEKYVKPNVDKPCGELIIVAGDKVLYYGDLPYINGNDGERGFPFVRQVAHAQVGCFWGASVIDRIIPIQRSYNAVKNRKHEFLNRLAMGVLTVEDGSVDTSNLEDEGLCPGKVLIYRQGSVRPSFMDGGNVPIDFSYEEDRLLNEFIVVSGVSELARNSTSPQNITSGVALQILVDQDDTRLSATAEEIRQATKAIGKHILRLYKQFALTPRLIKVMGDTSDVETYYFNSSDISSDDIVFDTENELNNSPANRKSMVMELLRAGVLYDENGRLTETNKLKILELMGFGNWESGRDLSLLHRQKAEKENFEISDADEILSIDDHDIHIDTHTAFVISGEADKLGKNRKQLIMEHIALHANKKMLSQEAINIGEKL